MDSETTILTAPNIHHFSPFRHVSTTNVKFLALTEAASTIKDDVMARKLRDLHVAYVDAFSNPLIDLPLRRSKSDAPALNSILFERRLQEIVS